MPDCRIFCKVLKIVRIMTKVRMFNGKLFFANSLESVSDVLLFKYNFKGDEQFINEIKTHFSEI